MNTQTELKVISPWFLQRALKSKKYSMSLNTFLGMDKILCNLLKSFYKKQIAPQIYHKKLKTPIEVTIQVYNPSKRRSDKSNYYSISSKFLYDALVEYGVVPDDNDEFIKTEIILPSIYEKGLGRVEFYFKSIIHGDEVNNG